MGKLLLVESSESSSLTTDDWMKPRNLDIDIPDHILFPDQLNSYLKEQVRALTFENGNLRRNLMETQGELAEAQQKHAVKQPLVGRASEMAASKIAELSKKLREQTAELEVMKHRTKDAEARLRHLEDNHLAEPVSPPPEDIPEQEKKIKSLTEKLQASNVKMCDFRNQCQTLKQELKLAQKVIETEVGEKVSFQELAKDGGSWRGRAQQILTLQNKIQQLQEQSSNSGTETPAVNLIRQIEKERRASYEETSKQLTIKTMCLEEMKKKLEAARARNKVLDSEAAQGRVRLSSILEQSDHDQRMVAALEGKLRAMEDKWKEQVDQLNKAHKQIIKCQEEVNMEEKRNEQMQRLLAERENRIRCLEELVSNIENKKCQQDEPDKEKEATPQDEPATKSTDAENKRLLELISVVNQRLEEGRKVQEELETQFRKERCKNAKLETKVGRLETERAGILKSSRGRYSQVSNRSETESWKMDQMDMMRQQMEYLEEECLALKTRIQTMQMEKNEDLQTFTSILEMRDENLRKKSKKQNGAGAYFNKRSTSNASKQSSST